jgi:hypothetical protein
MKLDCIDTDPSPSRDLAIGHPVLHGMHDLPFRRREYVIVWRATAASVCGHEG